MNQVECAACGAKYTEEEAKKLYILRATTAPEITILRVYCKCGHVLDLENFRMKAKVK